MANSIFVTATQRGSGKSTVVLGLVNLLQRSLSRVGYFKPIAVHSASGVDPDVALMKEALGLEFAVEEMAPVSMDQVTEALAAGKYEQLMDTVYDAYRQMVSRCDFVVCEGTDYFGAMASFEFNINADLSKNLGAPILLVANANGHSGCETDCSGVVKNITMVKESFDEKACDFFGVVINRVEPHLLREHQTRAQEALAKNEIRLLGAIPRSEVLERPRIEEIAAHLGAAVVAGEARMNVIAHEVLVAAMGVENVLRRLKAKGALVLVPGDRDDVLLGMAAAYSSPSVPSPAGVVMTGGLEPREQVSKLIADITQSQMPLLKVATDTYTTAIRINEVKPHLAANQRMRIEVVKGLVEQHVNTDPLLISNAIGATSCRMTPRQFLLKIQELARSRRQHIVLPEGEEERILRAAALLLQRNIVDITLLGNEQTIRQRADQLGLEIDRAHVIDPATSELREKFTRRYIELRAAKKVIPWEMAHGLMGDVSYFGTMMVQENIADGMVSGATHTTAHTLRPALEFVKTREGVKLASSVFFMCLPDRVLVYGDCAVNPNPTAEELADIALASAETARAFDIEPYVAMLSYSTGDSGTGSDVDKVREATRIVKEKKPELAVEGPIQYDAAIDPEVARTKLPKSKVAGAATVFVFPDLNSGNNTYKAVQRSAHAIAVGPVMQGLRKPVNDLSRGCTIPDIVNTVAITAIQAHRSR